MAADRQRLQVVSLTFRLFIRAACWPIEHGLAAGIDELRWFAPARPGDTCNAEVG